MTVARPATARPEDPALRTTSPGGKPVAQQNNADQTLHIEAARQAFQHRDRLSELERHAVEASYYSIVKRDRRRAVQALLRGLKLDPDNVRALNNLGIQYLFMGEPERAEEVFRRLVEMPRSSSTAYRNLIDTPLSLGRIEGAAETLARFEQAYPDHELLPSRRVQTLLLSGAVSEARAVARSAVEDPLRPATSRAGMWVALAHMAYWEGRHGDARRALLEAVRIEGQADEATAWARVVNAAYTAALVGDEAWAREYIEANARTSLSENVVSRREVAVRMIEL